MNGPFIAIPDLILGALVIASLILWIALQLRLLSLSSRTPALNATTPLPPLTDTPLLSIIIPARNEEVDLGPCLRSLLKQDYPHFEIIVISDESTDRTLALAREILSGFPRATVIEGLPRPTPDWVGKSWAIAQGLKFAKGTWLLFIDADVDHEPTILSQAMRYMQKYDASTLSIMPVIQCKTHAERIMMPLFALLTVILEAPDHVNDTERSSARLSGAFILMKADVYRACGGHEAVRNAVLDDMALASRLKDQGHQLHLRYTEDLSYTRMFVSFRETWHGMIRLSFPTMEYSVARLALALLATFLGTTVPILALMGVLFFPHGPATWWIAGLAALLIAISVPVLRPVYKLLSVPPAYAILLPVASHFFCMAAVASAIRTLTGQGIPWKGRHYD